ncbi:surface-exposed outer membrane lipoprotein YaiW [Salmonella enterica subsp. enterica serovar Braenderup]
MSAASRLYPLPFLAVAILAGCSSQSGQPVSKGEKPVDVASVVRQKMPASVKDREVWAKDIATTFKSQGLAPTVENICSVLAVAQQESGYQADPVVPGLSKIAWQEIDRRAERLHIPLFLVHTALKINSPNGKSYSERLDTVKTEKQLSAIFDDFINMVPMGQTLFGSYNPVHTGGPMQVSIAFAEQHAKGYPWHMAGTVRQEVFTRRGGLWFGTYHLLNYPANYSAPVFRFADFNAGWYASRNAAFQNAVSKASGVKLALDGDLIRYNSKEPGKTELAVRKLAGQLGMSEREIRSQLEKGDSLAFEKTALYKKVYKLAEAKTDKKVYKLAEAKTGKTLAREMLPGIQLESPKITRKLTTAWFAKRVDERRARCMGR